MEIFCINDIHINDYIPSNENRPRLTAYTKFLEKHTLPADVLVIGGDIAHDIVGTVFVLAAAANMFERVYWVPGNNEYYCMNSEQNLTTAEKLHKIDKFARTKSKAGRIVRLDGESVVMPNGSLISGGMGMSDADWFAKYDKSHSIEDIQTAWNSAVYGKLWKTGTDKFEEISNSEISRVLGMKNVNSLDYVVTHFAPSNLIDLNDYPNIMDKADKHFLAFDASAITDNLRDGAIYHFGHVHVKEKKIVKNKNGEFLLINNSIGRKGMRANLTDNPKKLTKEDFLITI